MTSVRTCFIALFIIAAHSGYTSETNQTATIAAQEMRQAVLDGNIDFIEQALQQGYQPDTRDEQMRTALMYAAYNGDTGVVTKLVEAGADVNLQDQTGTTALMFAASGPATEAVQYLLEHGAKVNMVDSNEHFSALMWAAAEGQIENVKLLLKHGADLKLKDVDGDTAASFAAQRGHQAIVTLLQETASKALKSAEEK